MRIYFDKSRQAFHGNKGGYVDLIPTAHNVTVLFSDDGYWINRREEISNETILKILREMFDKEV